MAKGDEDRIMKYFSEALAWLSGISMGLLAWFSLPDAQFVAVLAGMAGYAVTPCASQWIQRSDNSVPNLRGRWEGTLTTSYDDKSAIHAIVVDIRQQQGDIHIALESATARSQSLSAVLVPNPDGAVHKTLAYIYQARPLMAEDPDIHTHIGLCVLHCPEANYLSGYYVYYAEDVSETILGYLVLRRSSAHGSAHTSQ